MISSIITIGRFKRLRNIFSNTLYERYGNNIYNNNNNGLYKNNKVNSSGRPSNPNSNSETNLYKYTAEYMDIVRGWHDLDSTVIDIVSDYGISF